MKSKHPYRAYWRAVDTVGILRLHLRCAKRSTDFAQNDIASDLLLQSDVNTSRLLEKMEH